MLKMKLVNLVAGAMLLAAISAPVTSMDKNYKRGSVWSVTLVKVEPGKGDDYLDSLKEQSASQQMPAASLHPRPNLSSQYAAPVSEIEKTTAGIWQQVLGIAPIGLHDKFFELGGHSLLAVQLISQLREAFQVEIPAQRLFEAPTIAQLAASIEASLAAQSSPESEDERLARVLEMVEGMSEEEVAKLLANPDALSQVVNA